MSDGLSLASYKGQTVLSAAYPGAGRAVFCGDSVRNGCFDDDNIGMYDNEQLALNTVEFLIPEPATIALLGLGALSLIRRK
jgi:hypothetical protein